MLESPKLTLVPAHPPLHDRRLPPRLAPVHARPHPRPRRSVGIYIHVLPAHQGALCAEAAQWTCDDVSGCHCVHHRGTLLSVHPCSWQAIMRRSTAWSRLNVYDFWAWPYLSFGRKIVLAGRFWFEFTSVCRGIVWALPRGL